VSFSQSVSTENAPRPGCLVVGILFLLLADAIFGFIQAAPAPQAGLLSTEPPLIPPTLSAAAPEGAAPLALLPFPTLGTDGLIRDAASTPPTPQPLEVASSPDLYKDDFSNPSSGWEQSDTSTAFISYLAGGQYLLALKDSPAVYVLRPPHTLSVPLQDVSVSLQARFSSNGGYFGLYCRFQDPSNTYEIAFRNGAYRIGRIQQGKFTPLTSPGWVQTHYLSDPFRTNGFDAIEVTCLKDTLLLEVNGFALPAVTDTQLKQGDIYLFAVAGLPSGDTGVWNTTLVLDEFFATIPRMAAGQ